MSQKLVGSFSLVWQFTAEVFFGRLTAVDCQEFSVMVRSVRNHHEHIAALRYLSNLHGFDVSHEDALFWCGIVEDS